MAESLRLRVDALVLQIRQVSLLLGSMISCRGLWQVSQVNSSTSAMCFSLTERLQMLSPTCPVKHEKPPRSVLLSTAVGACILGPSTPRKASPVPRAPFSPRQDQFLPIYHPSFLRSPHPSGPHPDNRERADTEKGCKWPLPRIFPSSQQPTPRRR